MRADQHLRETNSIKKANTYFHNAIEKYGFDKFIFEQIDEAENQNDLDEKERFWISYYHSNNSKYGLKPQLKNGIIKKLQKKC